MPVLEGDQPPEQYTAPGEQPVEKPVDKPAPVEAPPQFEKTKELQFFMMSVRNRSSGSFQGNYSQPGGAYGIDSSRWDLMARRAGLEGANMKDTAMQDYVAAWTMRMLYAKYENWALVALAWSEGEGTANNLIKSMGRAPEHIQWWEVNEYTDNSFVGDVKNDMRKLGWKGIEGESALTLEEAVNQPTRIITGSGRVSINDPYNATVQQLYEEASAEQAANQPSATQVLFSQLDAWSRSIAGGDRMDYRTDLSMAKSEQGLAESEGSGQELEPMKIEER